MTEKTDTAFTMVRSEARRTWMYRIQPSANHPAFIKLERQLAGGPLGEVTPNRLRWNPLDVPAEPTDFIDGLVGMVANAGAEKPSGISIYHYRANCSMERVFFNADGELLIVPQQGVHRFVTEFGLIEAAPMPMWFRGPDMRLRLVNSAYVKAVEASDAAKVIADQIELIETVDGMTADYYPFTHDFLGETATRIINEVKGINRVTYDITSKPPGTIEWE